MKPLFDQDKNLIIISIDGKRFVATQSDLEELQNGYTLIENITLKTPKNGFGR